jgi:hypothetical protein
LAAAVALSLMDSKYGSWALGLWLVLTVIAALTNVIAGLSAGVVFRWAQPVERTTDSTYYVFNFGCSVALLAIAVVLIVTIVVFRLIL